MIIAIGFGGYTIFNNRIKNEKKISSKRIVKEKEKKEDITEDNDTKEINITSKDKHINTFSLSDEAGIVYVEGYGEIEHRKGSNYESSNEEVDYLLFHITKTESEDFMKWIENSKGNSFVGDKAIGLGCIKEGIIEYYNSSDEEENGFYKLNKDDSEKISKSSKETPVKLKLERKIYTSGTEAPMCYSHITNITVLE
jgi:hypothetical protein